MTDRIDTRPRRRALGLVAAFIFALGLGASGAGARAAPAPVTVFAAASLRNALDDVLKAYEAKTGVVSRASYAASSTLARQIEQGAPADVYVSADSGWMDELQGKRLIVAATRRDVLSNHLALIAPAGSKTAVRMGKGAPFARALGATLGGGRLAVAGPGVPAGIYAEASLRSLGVWDGVKDKLAPAENVRAALAYVAQGETPLGIVYDTDAKIEPKVRIVALFPDASHPPIVYPAAVVAASANPGAAGLLGFLQGPEASAVFRKYGFTVLARPK